MVAWALILAAFGLAGAAFLVRGEAIICGLPLLGFVLAVLGGVWTLRKRPRGRADGTASRAGGSRRAVRPP